MVATFSIEMEAFVGMVVIVGSSVPVGSVGSSDKSVTGVPPPGGVPDTVA